MNSEDMFLLHVCCAPCFAAARETVRRLPAGTLPPMSGIFFYNPNIHPLLEFRRRVKALHVYLERDPATAEIDAEYGLHAFLAQVCQGSVPPRDRRERCRRCYEMRLQKTAETAAISGVGAISTTLLASREQDRSLVAEVGKKAAAAFGLRFVETDLRLFLPEEKMLRGIYKQQYCGCIFSEEERFRTTGKHLYGAAAEE